MKLYKLQLTQDHIGLLGAVVAALSEDVARTTVANSDYTVHENTSRHSKDDTWWLDSEKTTCVQIGLADPYMFPHPEIVLIDYASE